MSKRGTPAEDNENPVETTGSKQKIKYNWHRYFRCRPVAFTQFLLAQVGSHGSSDQQNSYRNRVFKLARYVTASNPIGTIIFLLIAVAAGYLLYLIGLFTAPGITTLATVVLAVWAGMTWYTYNGQWRVMERQHKTMQDQIGQSQIASRQTEEIIKTMRLEKRAWLVASRPELDPLEVGKPPSVYVALENRGQTPAFAKGRAMDAWVDVDDSEIPRIIEGQIARAREQTGETAMGPDVTMGLHSDLEAILTQEYFDGITSGKLTLYVVGVVFYDDIFRTEHETWFCFKYNFNRKKFFVNKNHQRLT
jgi:hypothetical protein